MHILLDECLPRALARQLVGHNAVTVGRAGWAGIKNGELLRLAVHRFDVFLTIDQHLESQQSIPSTLALVTLVAPTNRIESLRPLVPAILQALESLQPGERVRIERR